MKNNINRIIKTLIISDFFFNSAWGLIAPIFALFIVQKITFNDDAEAAKIVGFATLFYWVIKSVLQIPIGNYLDKNHGEKDDFWFIFIGHIIAAFVPFGYLISTSAMHIYFFQILYAVGMAMLVPSWYAVFTRHIDKGKEAFEWGIDSTILGIGVGITGAIGGVIASIWGFEILFVFSGAINILSAVCMLYIYKDITKGENIFHQIPPIRPF